MNKNQKLYETLFTKGINARGGDKKTTSITKPQGEGGGGSVVKTTPIEKPQGGEWWSKVYEKRIT